MQALDADERCCLQSLPLRFHDFLMAAKTFAGMKGTERSRTPIASNTALPIAPGTIAADGSPAPHGT